jgi:tetratricopeptide (TPR) repeat protein
MKEKTEFIDQYRDVMEKYYSIVESIDEDMEDEALEKIKGELEVLLEKDPYFLESYLLLADIEEDEDNMEKAEELRNEAYEKALKLITDTEGNWPYLVLWERTENRHIIRTLLDKGLSLWAEEEDEEALEIFRNLFNVNPFDYIGVRDYLVAIRSGMSLEEFEEKFEEDEDGIEKMEEWFKVQAEKFPEEFQQIDEKIKYLEESGFFESHS